MTQPTLREVTRQLREKIAEHWTGHMRLVRFGDEWQLHGNGCGCHFTYGLIELPLKKGDTATAAARRLLSDWRTAQVGK
jgi:hypothetical protein